MKPILVLIVTGVALTAAQREPIGSLQSPIDSVFSTWSAKDSPGCALGVFKDGAMAYARGYGSASLEHDAPITMDSVFYAGSVSKQFTAMAAALAIQQGKLAYDDPIRKYLPELPAYADAIRISHLVHHTSGLRDYNTLLSIAGRRDEDAWDNRAVLRITARQSALNFRPGDEYLFLEYGLHPPGDDCRTRDEDAFRRVRRRADLQAARHDVVALPCRCPTPGPRARAGLRRSCGRVDARHADQRACRCRRSVHEHPGSAEVGREFLHRRRSGAPRCLKRLQTRGTLNDGTPLAYAWGLQIGNHRGLPIVEHSGSLGGYRAHLLRIPSAHTSVALLCNASSIGATGLAREVAGVILKDRFTAPPAPSQGGVAGTAASTPWLPTESELRDFAGTYYGAELDATFAILLRKTDKSTSQLMLQRDGEPELQVLRPGSTPSGSTAGAGEFQAGALRIRFDRDASGSVTGLLVDAGRVRGIKFVRQ